ncbi:Hypothetical predicted protein [Olea europaea subsp. europaea]|uniref:Uncharacterized protein n=1 Tax=Olea europaea subsp. europaea TaxID=158383 RepID=A0A8S0RI58_OLEEU|nr:Hypothetical predicted protein [Olea europaea subsp. europaea]
MGHLVLPSLQRRPVRPPSPNGCTWVGESGGRPCRSSISEKNFAGRSVVGPLPPPPLAADNAYFLSQNALLPSADCSSSSTLLLLTAGGWFDLESEVVWCFWNGGTQVGEVVFNTSLTG